jgi:hypothetical protein
MAWDTRFAYYMLKHYSEVKYVKQNREPKEKPKQ